MARNYSSEFNKLFKSGSCSVNGKDWTKPKYFDSQNNDCYAAEAALMSSLTSEAYSNFGLEVQYYIKYIDTKHDRLYGEDPLENIIRRFTLKMYVDSLPNLQKNYTIQGLDYQEIITCQCTIQHFMEASQLEYGTYEQKYNIAVPKIGDIVYIEYSNLYYEVINVKTFADGSTFLSSPITYTFSLRVWKNSHEFVDEFNENSDNMDELRKYVELDETFDLDDDSPNINKTSKVGPDTDILEINTDLPKDVDKKSEPTDNVNSHVEYQYKESKDFNPKYYDPFDGW